ncbi:MAG: hypothetical protein Q4E88_03915 [Coriobacteriia bacterium]|nr:hypothetical protein [Coriobacteriia bacterium]
MKKTCLKFLPVFLISIVCLIASIGFTGVNAHAENCDSASNDWPKLTFKADSEYGSIEGTTLYEFNEDCSITSNVNESTFKIFQFAVESKTTEINAVPIPGYAFDCWTRSDGKEFSASIYSDVEFTAHFKPGKRDPEMKNLDSRDAFFHVIDGSSCECHQVIFRKSNTELVVKSSNEDIATVSVIKTPQDQEAVLICGHNVGKATITVTSTGNDVYEEATKSFDVDVFGKVPLPVVHTTLKYNGASQVGIESSKYYTLKKATGIPFQEGVITEKGYEGTNIGVYAGYIDLKPGYYWEDNTSGSKYYEFRIVKGEE